MNEQADKPKQQLPGYELIERIGAGGYGEVWSASAPGGLTKAIKYVFGAEIDKRATHELRALEKIKEVRHPFILSLERIEVVENRLLVVSELADGSLRDRYRKCVEEGLPGIPRDELLRYLHDAADGLDFLATHHDLAHLDVKPENLLLVAGHVKVGDFGLVKSINNMTQQSLVGGMTPTYAAPEVFRGAPSRHSDQYSLAILYQEMLTGALPFGGVNAAELTVQHLNEDPQLTSLADAERFVTSRALSKEPEHRYESATDFINRLREASAAGGEVGFQPAAGSATPAAARDSQPLARPSQPTAADRCNATEVFDDSVAPKEERRGHIRFELPDYEGAPAEYVAGPESCEDAFTPQPAVFIGIGGTAGRVLRGLRASLTQHFGVSEPLRAVPMLLLDTDSSALAWATRGAEVGSGLAAADTVALPLRRPHAYRDRADNLLRWLGRRWLYNIPRSLTTEGIRPLGRLALVDHARRTFQRVRQALQDAASEQSVVETESSTGRKFDRGRLRVYVVSSVSGGAGSGMAIDVAYAVRSLLSKLDVGEASITGMMMHSTYRDTTRGDLSRVNAYSWLSEFERFRRSESGYPGDTSCGLPPHEAGVAAFDHTYFVPLGEQLDTAGYDIAARGVADYLFADAFTPAQHVLDEWRGAAPAGPAPLRTITVSRRQARGRDELSPLESAAAQAVVKGWSHDAIDTTEQDADSAPTDQIVHGAVAFIGESQLEASTLAAQCRSVVEAALGGDARAYVDSVAGETATNLSELFVSAFGFDSTTGRPTEVDGRPLHKVVGPLRDRAAGLVSRWVLSRLDEPGECLSGAKRALGWCRDHLRNLAKELEQSATALAAEAARRHTQPRGEDAEEELRRQIDIVLDQAALEAAVALAHALVGHTTDVRKELESIAGLFTRLEERLAAAVVEPDAEPLTPSPLLVETLRERVEADFLAPSGGMLAALATNRSVAELTSALTHAVRSVVGEMAADADDGEEFGELKFADSPLAEFGGKFTRLALAPLADALSPACVEALDGVTHVVNDNRESVLITETVGMSVTHLAADLIDRRRDYAAFAERVRTRRDVPWAPAVEVATPAATAVDAPASTGWGSAPVDTAVLG